MDAWDLAGTSGDEAVAVDTKGWHFSSALALQVAKSLTLLPPLKPLMGSLLDDTNVVFHSFTRMYKNVYIYIHTHTCKYICTHTHTTNKPVN